VSIFRKKKRTPRKKKNTKFWVGRYIYFGEKKRTPWKKKKNNKIKKSPEVFLTLPSWIWLIDGKSKRRIAKLNLT